MDATAANPMTPPFHEATLLTSLGLEHDHTPSSELAGPPPTPVDDSRTSAVQVETPSPPPTSYAKFLLDLQQTGFGEPLITRQSLKRPLSEAERRIPDWVMAAQGAGADEIQQDAAPPPAPPMSPTAGAPFIPQSQRLKKRRDETYASQEFLASSRKFTVDEASDLYDDDDDDDFEDDDGEHDPTQLQTPPSGHRTLTNGAAADDNVSEIEDLGSPLTARDAQYCGPAIVIDCSRGFSVTSYQELTEGTCHPEYLAEQLQADVAQLRHAAQGMDDMLETISQLESDVIIVVEMAKKLERRVVYLEKCVEDSLPVKDEDKIDPAFLKSLNDRIMTLESILLPLATEIHEQSLEDNAQTDSTSPMADSQNQIESKSDAEGLAELHAQMCAQSLLAIAPSADHYDIAA